MKSPRYAFPLSSTLNHDFRHAPPEKSPAVRQGFPRLLRSIALRGRSPSQFGSGLLRLIAVVEGEQRLPSIAEMRGPEGAERMRPLIGYSLSAVAEAATTAFVKGAVGPELDGVAVTRV
jgi:hypothetical protein